MQALTMTSNRQSGLAPALRRAVPLALLGAIGVLSLLLQPLPAQLLGKAPELSSLPPFALRALLLLNPLLLVLVAALAGGALAHRVGLGSVLAGTAPATHWPRVLLWAAGCGFTLGVVLAAFDSTVAPLLGPAWQTLVAAAPSGPDALAMSMLYGGAAEEVMLRWGAMSLVAWAAIAVLGRQRRTWAMVLAIILTAAVFAAAHLPVVAAQVELTAPIVLRTLLINGIAGLLYGWLFWRRHLEAAMVAHAATHLGLAALRAMLA
jgi:hypothetical protein